MSKIKFIYYLVDPISNEIRYIGQTDNPKHRFHTHLKDELSIDKFAWIESLRKRSLYPILKVVKEIEDSIHPLYASWREKKHILNALKNSSQLFNRTYIKSTPLDTVCEMLFDNNESFEKKTDKCGYRP